MKNGNINIVLGVDDNYFVPCCVLITSILVNTHVKRKIHFFIVYQKLSAKNMKFLSNYLQKYSCNVDFICKKLRIFDNFTFKNRPAYRKYISEETFFSLYLPSLLPNIDRVLYLDCDMICNIDIQTLYDQDLGKKLAGVVYDNPWLKYNQEYQKNVLKLPKAHKYFNAGMLLFDLQKMRQNNTQKVFWETLSAFSDKIHNEDQDILNISLYKKVKYLPVRFNCHPTFFVQKDNNYLIPRSIQNQMDKIKNNHNAILHFFGPKKPWVKKRYPSYFPTHPWKKDYFKYLDVFTNMSNKKVG